MFNIIDVDDLNLKFINDIYMVCFDVDIFLVRISQLYQIFNKIKNYGKFCEFESFYFCIEYVRVKYVYQYLQLYLLFIYFKS